MRSHPPAGGAEPVSLPPDVAGPERGVLEIRVDNLRWDLPGAPSNVQARVRWWGDAGEGSVIKLRPRPSGRDSHTCRFPVRCGPKPMRKYLKDMASLVLIVEDSRQHAQKGMVSVDVRMLDMQTPMVGCYPIVGHNKRALGRLDVRASLTFHPAVVSSFEMNEYLAANDSTLPLYPLPGQLPAMARVEEEPEQPAADQSDAGCDLFEDLEVRQRADLLALFCGLPKDDTRASKLQCLADVFRGANRHGRGGHAGGLAAEGVRRLVEELMRLGKRSDAGAHKYLCALLEPDAGAALSEDALKDAYRQAAKCKGMFVDGGDIQVVDVLRRLASAAGERRMELKQAFKEAGVLAPGGGLDVAGIVLLLRRLFDWISRREEMCLLAFLYKHDLQGTGKFSFHDLSTLLRSILQMDALPVGMDKENVDARTPAGFSWSNLMSPGKAHPAGDGAAPATLPPPGLGLSGGAVGEAARLSQGVLYRPSAPPPPNVRPHGSREPPASGPVGSRPAAPPPERPAATAASQGDALAELISRAERLCGAMDDAIRSGHPVPANGDWTCIPSGHNRERPSDTAPLPGYTGAPGVPPYHPPPSPPQGQPLEPAYLPDSLAELLRERPDSDPVQEEIDDLLLEELFLKPSHEDVEASTAPAAARLGVPAGGPTSAQDNPATDCGAGKEAADPSGVQPGAGPTKSAETVAGTVADGRLQLTLKLSLRGALEACESGTQVIVKSAGGCRAEAFFPPGPASALILPVEVVASQNGRLQLAIELWKADEPAEHSDTHARFLGMASLACAIPSGGEGGAPDGHVLDVRNIFKGTVAGQVEAQLLCGQHEAEESPARSPSAPAPTSRDMPEDISLADAARQGADDGLLDASAAEASPACLGPRPGDSMVHCFEVTVVSCGGLPSGQEVEMELGLGPETRYIAYTFPGDDEPLYTNEVEPNPDVSFGANARHRVTLPAGDSILSYLQHAAEAPALDFQVWDRWPSGAGSVVGRGKLPLQAVLDAYGGGDGGATQFDVMLAYDADAPEAGISQEAPAIAVEICYSAEVLPAPSEETDDRHGEVSASDTTSISATDLQANAVSRMPVETGDGPLQAEMCVEIHQAAGLKAAVREAAQWLGGGSSVLGRAGQLGPHSYVRLSLFPSDEELDLSVPPLKTTFQTVAMCAHSS
eukprot:jgi/Tetstr1/426162/TSEL_016489.t1